MKALFVSSSHETGTWLSEVTHPYWHLIERGIDVDFSSPDGGRVNWSAMSDPYSEQSQEADDLVSKGFLSDTALVERLTSTLKLAHVDLEQYDIIHFTGGGQGNLRLLPQSRRHRRTRALLRQRQGRRRHLPRSHRLGQRARSAPGTTGHRLLPR